MKAYSSGTSRLRARRSATSTTPSVQRGRALGFDDAVELALRD